MNNSIRFGCTSLANRNVAGKLKRDKDGYYEVVLGALDVYNSAGEYYVYEQAKELFERSSAFMRRVQRGALRGEWGHPKPDGMSTDAYINRVLSLYEGNISHQIREVWLDFESIRDESGKRVVAIMGWVIPSGPQGTVLQKQLDNPNENACFSIRAFTKDYQDRGIRRRILQNIVTWDAVNEPGILHAEKYRSPSLESFKPSALIESVDTSFTSDQLKRATTRKTIEGVAQESALTLSQEELFQSFGWNLRDSNTPSYMKW